MKPTSIAEIRLEERSFGDWYLVYVDHSGWPAKEVKVPYTKRYEVLADAHRRWFQAIEKEKR